MEHVTRYRYSWHFNINWRSNGNYQSHTPETDLRKGQSNHQYEVTTNITRNELLWPLFSVENNGTMINIESLVGGTVM